MNSFLLLVLLALKRTAFLQDRRSRTSLIPVQRHLLTLLITFTAAVHTMAPKHSHNRITSHPSSLIDSSAILFLDHGIFQACCGTVNTTAHPLPSRSHLSCLAVCETQVISSHFTLSGRSRWQMCSAYNIVFMIPCLLAAQWKQHLETRICRIFSVLGN